MTIFDMTIKEWIGCIILGLGLGTIGAILFGEPMRTDHRDAKAIDRAAVLLIESDIDAETRRAGVEALAELLRVRRGTP